MFTGPAYASLKADTGMYLNRIYYTNNGRNSIEAEKSTQDFATKFLVKRCSDEKLVLLAGNGKYLSRIHRGGIDYIEAAKSRPDVYSRFQVYNQPDGTVVLKEDNGKYLSPVYRGETQNIEAAKSSIDEPSKFKLQFQL